MRQAVDKRSERINSVQQVFASAAGLQGSGRACTQLTSLLSSVQASLAELKVEVSSAQSELGKSRCQIHNKLSLDATLQKSIPSSGCAPTFARAVNPHTVWQRLKCPLKIAVLVQYHQPYALANGTVAKKWLL